VLRKAFDVPVEFPTRLRNIAFWDYWEGAEWATSLGQDGTRIQIMSLGWGWLWFIPISKTKTSVGLVLPADYYKKSGKSKEQLYAEAIACEPLVSHLLRDATPTGDVLGTKDWNFLSERLAGENWFLAGDSCGFADPILSAGMSLAHSSAQKVAYSILESSRKGADATWLRDQYTEIHRGLISQHIQFADYWYSANGRFTDLKDYCSEIAESAGLTLDADGAFRWLATGGFTLEAPGTGRAFSWGIGAIKFIVDHFANERTRWKVATFNVWKLNLDGATKTRFAHYFQGRVHAVDCFRRERKLLPFIDLHRLILTIMDREQDASRIVAECVKVMREQRGIPRDAAIAQVLDSAEGLFEEGWVCGEIDQSRPMIPLTTPEESGAMHRNRDNAIPS
jgi:hypothetical protein